MAPRRPLRRAHLLLLVMPLLVGAVAACSASVSVGDVQRDPGMTEFAPRDPNAALKAVKLGTSDTDAFDHARTGTSFAAGTTKVGVWYRWEGAETGTRIDIRWSQGGQTILEQNETLDQPSGDSAWFLFTQSGNAIPAGQYQVELLEDGTVQSTIPFTVEG